MNNIVEIILRCVAVYFFIIIALRVFGKKELAQLSVVDLVFILLISNSVQNAMVGSDASLHGGLLAALSLFVINFLLKRIFYRHKNLSDFLQGKELLLIYKGNINDEHLRKANITVNELLAAVREHGVSSIDNVDLAMLEVDGNISIVSHDYQQRTNHSFYSKKKHRFKGRITNI